MGKITVKIIIVTIFIIFFQAAVTAAATLEIIPNVVRISTFYNGTTVSLTGQIPETAEVVIRVTGKGEELYLKKKGKVGGLLWMNTGGITLENAARVDMIYTSKSVKNLEFSGAESFGLEALKDRISVIPASENKNFILDEFIKLKKKDGLYTVNPEGVIYGSTSQGMKSFTVTAAIPPRMSQGDYRVEMVVMQHDRIVEKLSRSLKIEQVGFPATLSRIAFDYPLLHGIMAVLIALGAGLFIGTIFRNKGRLN